MLPSAFLVVSELPLTPNLKLDRKALQRMASSHLDYSTSLIAPQTVTEEVLAGVWMQVLKLKSVGIDDNYFVLGGDSSVLQAGMIFHRELRPDSAREQFPVFERSGRFEIHLRRVCLRYLQLAAKLVLVPRPFAGMVAIRHDDVIDGAVAEDHRTGFT